MRLYFGGPIVGTVGAGFNFFSLSLESAANYPRINSQAPRFYRVIRERIESRIRIQRIVVSRIMDSEVLVSSERTRENGMTKEREGGKRAAPSNG
jgi:hypothetical protein